MRRTTLAIAAVSLGALVVAGWAAATFRASGVTPATATFSATGDGPRSSTCTGNGNTYRITNGRYNGKIDFASPNDDLDGDLTLTFRSVYNATGKVGWVEGIWRTKNDRRQGGIFRGVLGESGGQVTMSGFLHGTVGKRYARLLSGVAATLRTDSVGTVTSVDGTLGQGTLALPAVVAGQPCSNDGKPNEPIPVKLYVKGQITALSADSITVNAGNAGAQTCAVVAGVSPSLSGFLISQSVEMSCGIVNGKMTLLKLKKNDHEKDKGKDK
ncbi:MAG: hypothetical protein U0R50_05435 [Gaiellales bacterium]